MTDVQKDRIYQFMLDQHQRRPFTFKAVSPEESITFEGIFTILIGMDVLALKAINEDKKTLDCASFVDMGLEDAVDWIAETCDYNLKGDYVTTI